MIIQSITQITSINRSRHVILLDIVADNLFHYLRTKQQNVGDFTITNVLLMAHILTSKLLQLVYGVQVTIPKELQSIPAGRYLIVANHRKAADPYLISATLPFSVYQTLLPIRFFTANLFLKHWWQRLIMEPFGCFRAYATEGKLSGVKGGLQLSDRGQTLFIFPEGKRMRGGMKRELKIGVAYLAQRRDFTILPVYVDYTQKSWRKMTTVRWGKPFKISTTERTIDLNELTLRIFSHVSKLSMENKL